MDSDTFKHQQFSHDQPNFRLLLLGPEHYGDIKCELIEAVLDDSERMPYAAISHRWQYGEADKAIWIGKSRFFVTSAIFTMLDALRSPDNRKLWDGYFWIDSLCINQNDQNERSHQVRHMKEIYTTAEHVIIWLGEATPESDLVMKALAALKKHTETRRWLLDDEYWREKWEMVKAGMLLPAETNELYRSLASLLSHSWFRRVWVLQEVANARSASVRCGNKWISTCYFAMGPRLMGVKPSAHCQAVLDLMPSPKRRNRPYDDDLYSLLRRFCSAEATDQKDRIYALLGLCSEKTGNGMLIPNYSKTTDSIIWGVVSHICFCDEESLPKHLFTYGSIGAFLSDLDTIDTTLLLGLIRSSDYSSIEKFLGHRKKHIQQSGAIVEALVEYPEAEKLTKLVLDHLDHPDCPPFMTGKTLLSIAKNEREGASLMRMLAPRCRQGIIPTLDVLIALASNKSAGLSILEEMAPATERYIRMPGGQTISLWNGTPQGQEIVEFLSETLKGRSKLWSGKWDQIKKDLSRFNHLLRFLSDFRMNNAIFPFEDIYCRLEAAVEGIICDTWITPSTMCHQDGFVTSIILRKNTKFNAFLADQLQVPYLNDDVEKLPSLLAAKNGDLNLLTELIENGANMEYQDEWGESLLAIACRSGHKAVVKYLCERGANVNSKSVFGWTPLRLATEKRYFSITELLRSFGGIISFAYMPEEQEIYWEDLIPIPTF